VITLEQAKKLQHGHIVHAGACRIIKGSRGGYSTKIVRLRVSGKLLTWKRSPERWELPLKYGLYDSYRLTDRNAQDFHLEEECPLLQIKEHYT
jgi:hypothetical protein